MHSSPIVVSGDALGPHCALVRCYSPAANEILHLRHAPVRNDNLVSLQRQEANSRSRAEAPEAVLVSGARDRSALRDDPGFRETVSACGSGKDLVEGLYEFLRLRNAQEHRVAILGGDIDNACSIREEQQRLFAVP